MENPEIPCIPFMGDLEISPNTQPDQLASWVDEYDRVPLLLALSLYNSPADSIYPFKLIPNSNKIRVAAWKHEELNIVVIGCRGTDVFGRFGHEDLADDSLIATGPYCDISLVGLASTLADEYGNDNELIFAGHSLGGTATMCLTIKYPDSRGISFNGGAAPTNPIIIGPGPARFTHYHIVGDLISSHMSLSAANVIRIKILNIGFGSAAAHSSGNLLPKPFQLYSADQEDDEYLQWGSTGYKSWNIVKRALMLVKFHYYMQIKKIVESSPIPGSQRFNNKK